MILMASLNLYVSGIAEAHLPGRDGARNCSRDSSSGEMRVAWQRKLQKGNHAIDSETKIMLHQSFPREMSRSAHPPTTSSCYNMCRPLVEIWMVDLSTSSLRVVEARASSDTKT